VSKLVQEAHSRQQRRRADAIVLYAAGLNAEAIAQALAVHPHTIYADLHTFHQYGLACVQSPPAVGAPVRISATQVEEIGRLAEIAPYELGLPYGRWSLSKLRAYLIKTHVVKTISREHLRQVLKKRGSVSDASAASSSVMIRNGGPS
jgi:transposase